VSIQLANAPSWTNIASNSITHTLSTVAEDNMYVIVCLAKYSMPSVPAGWTDGIAAQVLGFSGGLGSQGADSGAVYVRVVWRVIDAAFAASPTNPTFTCTSATGNVMGVVGYRLTKLNSDGRWGDVIVMGQSGNGLGGATVNWSGSVTANLSHNRSGAVAGDIKQGDFIWTVAGVNTDANSPVAGTSGSLSTAGVTYGGSTASPAAPLLTSVGHDLVGVSSYRVVSSGSSTDTAGFGTYTLSFQGTATGNAPSGVMVAIRVRTEKSAPPPATHFRLPRNRALLTR
jgi:hypothetical protein